MSTVKSYKTYPIRRERDGTYTVVVGKTLQDIDETRGQFDSILEAEAFIDGLLDDCRRSFMGEEESGRKEKRNQ